MKIPLLYDHHSHPGLYASLAGCLNLGAVTEKRKAIEAIGTLHSDINVVLGWNDGLYVFSRKELESFTPVIIINLSLHKFVVNDSARKILLEKDEVLIHNMDNVDWMERNLQRLFSLVLTLIPFSPENLFSFMKSLERSGIYKIEDMLVESPAYIDFITESTLTDRILLWTSPAVYRKLNASQQQKIIGLKLFTDGALGAQTAALSKGFLSGEKGMLLYSDDQLYSQIAENSGLHSNFAIHAIGDTATEQVARVLGMLSHDGIHVRARLEHGQFIAGDTARKLKELGVTLSMQPNFNSDSLHYSDRLGKYYVETNNPFRMLIDEAGFVPGEDLVFGSDGMPHGFPEAIKQSLNPAQKGQQLTINEFVKAYCMESDNYGYIEFDPDNLSSDMKYKVVIQD